MTQEKHKILLSIAQEIVRQVNIEFESVFRTGQLRDSARVIDKGDEVLVVIDPVQYNFALWRTQGRLVVYNPNVSYATYVNDVTGGDSGLHYNFMKEVLQMAIEDGLWSNGVKAYVNGTVNSDY